MHKACEYSSERKPSYRAENSNTHRHLCEFTGLDFEMAIDEHYAEVMTVIERLFIHIFEGLTSQYGAHSCLFMSKTSFLQLN